MLMGASAMVMPCSSAGMLCKLLKEGARTRQRSGRWPAPVRT